MHDLDRIEEQLANAALSDKRFERCAQDLLSPIYPGLTPISGGTDWGRDADVAMPDGTVPPRLLATTSRKLDGVRKNMLRGITSMEKHQVPFDRIILANPANLTLLERNKLAESAAKRGAHLDVSAIFDRGFFASKLRCDGYWRKDLLGLSSEPITLSRIPPELAESPWAALPLVGRDDDLVTLGQLESDVIVTGPPGVGKSRLLQELPDFVFVDKDASYEQIANDLRWASPRAVVIDDSGQFEDLIRRLLWARSSEPDVFNFRLLAVCWPGEADRVSDWLAGATRHEVRLLERSAIDAIVMSMGVTGQIARTEILNQAEGRPAWAVALSDLLLRANDAESLLRGGRLYGEVSRYLRRAGIAELTVDVLAVVAALGEITEIDIADVASELGIPTVSVASMLTGAARSGLIDIETAYVRQRNRDVRSYEVRPPMLARALVAERVFAVEVPVVDLSRLASRWPERTLAIALAAVDAAHLGAPGARPASRGFFEQVVTSAAESATKAELAKRYLYLDLAAANEVLDLVRTEFDAVRESNPDPWVIEPLLDLASCIADRYLLPEAVKLLLDAALLDMRPPHANPGSPPRLLQDLVHRYHPELPAPTKQRDLLASTIEDWITAELSAERWQAYSEQVENVLSLRLSSSYTAPGDPRVLQIREGVVSATEIQRICDEVWPTIRRRLSSAPVVTSKGAITAVQDWLHIGRGHDQPSAGSHPASAIETAARCGERLLRDLADSREWDPGLAACLRDMAASYGVAVDVKTNDEYAAFFTNVDRLDDWQGAIDQVSSAIAQLVKSWTTERPTDVVPRLLDLRDQLELSPVRWPDRVVIACNEIAKEISEPLAWIDAASSVDLFPEGAAFIHRAYELGEELGGERLVRLLGNPRSRWATLEAVLVGGTEPDRQYVIESVQPGDFGALSTLFLREQLSGETTRLLLTVPEPSGRAAVAASMVTWRKQSDNDWQPPMLEEWRSAIEQLEMSAVPGLRDYEAGRLAEFLAQRSPESLVTIIVAAFKRAEEAEARIELLPSAAWDNLHRLPWEAKDRLWAEFGQGTHAWQLRQHLVGTDSGWLRHALEEGLLTVDDALSSFSGFGPHPSVDQLAQLLIPRGVDPVRIAVLAELGLGWGEDSERYGRLIETFEAYAQSAGESIAALGRAGVERYSRALAAAEERDRKKRVRGEL